MTNDRNDNPPPGYKRTEIGVIPEEWDVCFLGDLKPFVTSGSRGWARYYSNQGSSFLRITNLSRESIYIDLADLKLVQLPPNDTEGLRTQLVDGDLLISITADIGIIGFIDQTVPKPAYINQHIALARFDKTRVDSRYLSYTLASEQSQRVFRSTTDQGAKAGMNLAGVKGIRAALPPLAEQRAIAAALADVDALLVSLEALIAKQRALKQATMQQLLTGKTRLPGFAGEWERRILGDLEREKAIKLFRGKVISQRDIDRNPGSYPIYSSSVHDDGLFGSYGDYMLDEELITWSVDGGGHFFYRPKHKFSVTNVCGYMRILSASLSCRFLAYVLQELHSHKTFDYTMKAHPSVIRNEYLVPLPSLPEQRAIAGVLADMDAELAALERRRAKTRQVKQGMMQQLLTGRVRLSEK